MLKIGAILQERYHIQHMLGSGGFGAVYYAEDLRLANRPVAIKHFYTTHLPPDEAAEMAALFQSEAHTLARLNHANLAQVYDYFSEGSDWFLVMEFVPGETLQSRLKRLGRPVDEPQVLEWAIEICRVLEYLHSQHPPLVFRDLKPANIMVTPDERVILIDFGIVRSFKEGQARDTYQMGTLGYAPPEQFGGQTEPRSDIYSLGVTLYTLLTGERPSGESFALPYLGDRAPWVSPALADLVAWVTAYDIAQRPPSAFAVRRELEALQQQFRGLPRPSTAARYPDNVIQAPALQPDQVIRHASGRGPSPHVLPLPAPVAPVRSRSSALIILLSLLLVLGGTGAALYASGLLPLFGGRNTDDQGNARAADGAQASPTATATPTALPVLPSGILVSISVRRNQEGTAIDRDIALLSLDGSVVKRLIIGTTFDYFGNHRPDGKIVFSRSLNDSEEHIATADADGGNVRVLTSGNTINRAGVWSPDGSLIAFESNQHSGTADERDIYVMNADGSNVRRITNLAGWQGGPSWSPDGKFIVFHSLERSEPEERALQNRRAYHLSVVEVESGEVRHLVSLPETNLLWPSWSPDGGTIAFMASSKTAPDTIYLVPASGGAPTRLELAPGHNRWPRWSPDGSLLAFENSLQPSEGPFRVFVYSVEDGSVAQVSGGLSDDRWPGW